MIEYQSLTIDNFGPYYGSNKLSFAGQGGTPVTLVDGKNGYGKTTILQALQWLLYGDHEGKQRQDLLNRTAASEGDTELSVNLQFQYKNSIHQVIRSLETSDTSGRMEEDTVYLVDGKPQPNFQARVREILPEPASQFFFFNGARIDRYADLENDRAVRDAIEMVLGLPAYENAVTHLSRLEERWQKRARKEQAKNKDLKDKVQTIDQLEQEIDNLEDQIEKKEEELTRLEERDEEIREELRRYEGYRDRINKIESYEDRLENTRERVEELREAQAQKLRTYAQRAVLPILQESLKRKRDVRDDLAEHRERIERRRFVQEFLEEVRKKASEASIDDTLEELESLLDQIHPPISSSQRREADLSDLSRLETEVADLEAKVNHLGSVDPEGGEEKLQTAQTRKAQLESELRQLRRNLEEVDVEEANELQHEQKQIHQKMGTVETRISELEDKKKEKTESYNELQRKVAQRESSDKGKQFTNLAERASTLESAFQAALERVEVQKRKSIEEHATEIFRKLTRKREVYDRLRINEDYTLDLLDRDGLEHSRDQISAGEKQLVALSFIVGLMKSTDKDAPLVIDTPFGHLDKLHRENVMEHLPSLDQQLMFLVTDADIAKEHEPIINQWVGKKFKIVYDGDRKVSRLEEVRA